MAVFGPACFNHSFPIVSGRNGMLLLPASEMLRATICFFPSMDLGVD
jgi:hypothetical protein